MTEPSIYLRQLELGPMQNFVYLVGDPATREAAVVDPAWDVEAILDAARQDGYQIRHAFVTHTHVDHVNGVAPLVEATDARVHVQRDEARRLDVQAANVSASDDEQTVRVGQVPVRLIHTPGHTPGSQCLLVGDRLLSGDTLFIGGCGRCDLPGGDAAELYRSLTQRLRRLDDGTVLLPGHHYAETPHSSLGQERQRNPFLQPSSVQEFLRLVGAA